VSILDQSLLIANVNYHVGHWVAIYVAEEQGFFKEEGLTRYEYERGGLLPGPSESQTLGLAIKEHGVDIATAVDTESAIYQRAKGADVYIVGGWRYTPFLKWYARSISPISVNSAVARSVSERSQLTAVGSSNFLSKRL